MASKEELVAITNVVRAISTAENENEIMRALGLRNLDELLVFHRFLFSQADSNKEVYLFMLGVSEEEFIKKLEELGWVSIEWKDEWDTTDSCGCCFTNHPAGFYGKSPSCEGERVKIVSISSIFEVLLELKEKNIYQY